MSTSTPALDALINESQRIIERSYAYEYAKSMAVGYGYDDPDTPTIVAVWFEDSLYSLVINDVYADAANSGEMSWEEVGVLVNAAILNAKTTWAASYAAWLDEARGRIEGATDFAAVKQEMDSEARKVRNDG